MSILRTHTAHPLVGYEAVAPVLRAARGRTLDPRHVALHARSSAGAANAMAVPGIPAPP